MGLVESGADQIIHRAVDHDKQLRSIAFGEQNARQKNARFGHDRAARFQQQSEVEILKHRSQTLGKISNAGGALVRMIGDAEAAA